MSFGRSLMYKRFPENLETLGHRHQLGYEAALGMGGVHQSRRGLFVIDHGLCPLRGLSIQPTLSVDLFASGLEFDIATVHSFVSVDKARRFYFGNDTRYRGPIF